MRAAPDPPELRAALRATYAAFFAAGFAAASWASRIPQLRDRLELAPSGLGLVLLGVAVGSLIALPLSGPIVGRLGSRRTVRAMAVVLAGGLLLMCLGYATGVVLTVLGLLVLGCGNGAWDVAMNVQGARLERLAGRSFMPRLHAGFSLGTVGGGLVGAAAIWLGVPVPGHLAGVALLTAVLIPLEVRAFVPDTEDDGEGDAVAQDDGSRRAWVGWTEHRTLLVGLLVLAFAFAEGVGNDWIGVALIDGHNTSSTVGALGFTIFLAAMTVGRWFGPGLLNRHGRVAVVRGCALVAVAGLLLFVLGPWVPLAFVGALLWGVGTSLGFPVGMSAAADDPADAASRVSVVASIGYCAFLAGPPVIGFLGGAVTVLLALLAVAVVLAVGYLLAGHLEPLHSDTDPRMLGA